MFATILDSQYAQDEFSGDESAFDQQTSLFPSTCCYAKIQLYHNAQDESSGRELTPFLSCYNAKQHNFPNAVAREYVAMFLWKKLQSFVTSRLSLEPNWLRRWWGFAWVTFAPTPHTSAPSFCYLKRAQPSRLCRACEKLEDGHAGTGKRGEQRALVKRELHKRRLKRAKAKRQKRAGTLPSL